MQSFDGYTVYKMNANMGMEEQILAEGCRKGDNAARRELYDRYAGRLLAVCLRYSGDRSTAEDLMHDAFLKIYGAFDRFSYRGPGSLRAWMERITRHPGARPVGAGTPPARRVDGVRQRIA